MKIHQEYDAIIIGSGMGGMSAGAMLAKDGFKVLILEAAHAPGGCSSSYKRKGYIFESGATTLIGFDENQPLWYLEKETGIRIPREEISPGMSVWLDGQQIIRYKNRDRWIEEAGRVFGNPGSQRRFWKEALRVSDLVWKLAIQNPLFPPVNVSDWIRLGLKNAPADALFLKYAFRSVADVMKDYGLNTPAFKRFADEQLMITAQAASEETPFLFGAAGLTYTNYSSYYVPGGLLEMVKTLQNYIESRGGALHTREKVEMISDEAGSFRVYTKKKKRYRAPIVISNIPVWNIPEITTGNIKSYFQAEAGKYDKAWGAITLGIATTDRYPDGLSLHHQVHLRHGETIPFTNSDSFFVSMSRRNDQLRSPVGKRTLNISTHASPDVWFSLNGNYAEAKSEVEQFVLGKLKEELPGFAQSEIDTCHTATPVSWQTWVNRKKGRVGGIPQSMARSLLKWTPNKTPFKGLYLCGDTTYPGQGIPGVTLSGINVYCRVKKNH